MPVQIDMEIPRSCLDCRLLGTSTAPVGSVWISNGKSRFGGERKKALLPEPWEGVEE